MKIISFFNGMNCGAMALEVAGLPIDKYYSYEIDKHAIKSTQTTHPNTIQMGSVVDFDINHFMFEGVDLFIGGSPCQSFSFAGKRKGMSTKDEIEIHTLEHYLKLKSESYEFEGQSYLFWEYIRALTDLRKLNPDIKFLLENVIMGKKWETILTRAIGVNPIEINSALVSAQNRRRLYWTNIGLEPSGLFGDLQPTIKQPKDKGILLKDILENEVDKKYFLSEKIISGFISHTKKMKEKGNGFEFRPTEGREKGKCLTQRLHKMGVDDNYIVAMRGRNPENPKSRQSGLETEQQLEPRNDGKTNCLTSVHKDNLVMQINPSLESNGKQPYQQNRIYDVNGISPALCANKSDLIIGNLPNEDLILGCDFRKDEGIRIRENGKTGTLAARARNDESCGQLAKINSLIRRLTPRECGRLQTIPTHHLETMLNSGISDTQLYRMFGNGWTVDVIVHILSYIKIK